jgi:predicted ABC-type exoprotein transport system permease subunit
VKLHRALTLVVMIVLSLVLIAAMTIYGVATFNSGSLAALAIVLAAAAIAGIAFSWRRYFQGRR